MIEHATVTAPEMIGLLVWWIVMLVAPVILVAGGGSRRRKAAKRLRRQVGRPAPEEPGGSPAPPPSAAAISRTRTAPASRPTAPRLSSQALEPLCRYVDFQRRLQVAASELRSRLSQLPAARWRIEPYPLTGERRNTLLVLGETGVFVISATYPPGDWDDVVTVSRLAAKIQTLLSGVLRPGPLGDLPSVQPGGSAGVAPRRRPRRVDRRVADRRRLGDRVASALRDRAWPRSRVTWLGLTRCRHRTGSSPRCRRSPAGRRCPSATRRTHPGDRAGLASSIGVQLARRPAASGESMRSISAASSRATSESSPNARAIALSATPSSASPSSATARSKRSHCSWGPRREPLPGRSSWESCMLRAPGCGRWASPSWSA